MTFDNIAPLDRNSWPTLVADHAAKMIAKLPDPAGDATKETPDGSAGVPPSGDTKHEGS